MINEFSYAVDADPSLPSVIQRLWDSNRREVSSAFVVLCTSITEAVERHFQVDGPLYWRRTRELRIEPFSYRDASLFFPQWSRIDRAIAWGIVMGERAGRIGRPPHAPASGRGTPTRRK